MAQLVNTPPTVETNTDFEVRSLDAMCVNDSHLVEPWYHNIK
jgi:hypothetical protein